MEECDKNFSVAVVIPIYNEELGLAELVKAIEAANPNEKLLLILVDDGSTDGTIQVFRQLPVSKNASRRILVRLSRNFGLQPAIFAGLAEVPNGVPITVVMDGDFQDLPEDIPKLVEKVRSGVDCAYAVRKPKAGNYIINMGTIIFYSMQKAISSVSIPPFAGNFCAFSDRFRNQLLQIEESEVFFPGVRAYLGFTQSVVAVTRGPRKHGISKMGFFRLLGLGFSGLTGFSAVPMRLIFILGFLIIVPCFSLGILVIVLRILGFIPVFGYTSLVLLILTMSGLQIMLIGIVGEYLGKVFIEIKRRPRWIVSEVLNE